MNEVEKSYLGPQPGFPDNFNAPMAMVDEKAVTSIIGMCKSALEDLQGALHTLRERLEPILIAEGDAAYPISSGPTPVSPLGSATADIYQRIQNNIRMVQDLNNRVNL